MADSGTTGGTTADPGDSGTGAACDTHARWRLAFGCYTVGNRPFDWAAIEAALDGHFDVGDLRGVTVEVAYGGPTRLRHYRPDCPPRNPSGAVTKRIWRTRVPLAAAERYARPAERHSCADGFGWLTADVRTELALLADARLLTRPWRSAEWKTRARGYPVVPADHGPLTSGLLADLAAACAGYAAAHPARRHIAALADRLAAIRAGWQDVYDQRSRLAAADPQSPVRRWQAGLGLPALTGSERQVRWAEQIRQQLHDDDARGWADVAARETSAGVWIALDQQGSGDLLGDWLALRERSHATALRRAELDAQRARW